MKQKERAYCHNTRENGLLFHLKEGKKTDKISKIAKSMSQSQIAITFRIIASHIEYRKMSKNIALVISGGRAQVVVSTAESFDIEDLLQVSKQVEDARQYVAKQHPC